MQVLSFFLSIVLVGVIRKQAILYPAFLAFPPSQHSQTQRLMSMDKLLPKPHSSVSPSSGDAAQHRPIISFPLTAPGRSGFRSAHAHRAATASHLTTQPACTRRPALRRGRARGVISVFENSLDPAALSSILLSEPVAASWAFSVFALQALRPSAWTPSRTVRHSGSELGVMSVFLCAESARRCPLSKLVGRPESAARRPP